MTELFAFVATNEIPWSFMFSVLNLSVIVWWIRGMAERKRANTEGVVAEQGVSSTLIGLLQEEVSRLSARVGALEKANEVKDTTISDLTAEKLALVAHAAAQKIEHSAAMSAETLLKMAALAEAQVMRSRMDGETALVAATLEGAHETGRVADAAERAMDGRSKPVKSPAKIASSVK